MLRNNKFSIIVALVILVLSLTSSQTFSNSGLIDIPYIDKMAHFGFYFLFMSVIIIEHRNTLLNTRQLLLASLVPFGFGTIIELLQSGIDILNRSGEILDLISNLAGITAALFLWLFIRPFYHKQTLK